MTFCNIYYPVSREEYYLSSFLIKCVTKKGTFSKLITCFQNTRRSSSTAVLQHQESNQYPSVISREKISSIENSLALSASGQQSQLTSGLSTLTSVHSGGNNGIQSGSSTSSTSYNRNRRSLTASSKYRSQFAAKHQQANQQVRNIFSLNIF